MRDALDEGGWQLSCQHCVVQNATLGMDSMYHSPARAFIYCVSVSSGSGEETYNRIFFNCQVDDETRPTACPRGRNAGMRCARRLWDGHQERDAIIYPQEIIRQLVVKIPHTTHATSHAMLRNDRGTIYPLHWILFSMEISVQEDQHAAAYDL